MPNSLKFLSGLLLLAGVSFAGTPAVADQAQAHVGHVASSWGNTPDNQGFLTTAEGEAAVALLHAGLASRDLTDLAAIKMHTYHAMHALDPSHVEGGPGMGYGLDKAVAGVIAHIALAANSEDASDAVKLHARHISASAANVADWSSQAMGLMHELLGMEDAEAAGEVATKVELLLDAIVNGRDANGDGRIGWQEGEGGLAQARLHMGLLLRAEGLE